MVCEHSVRVRSTETVERKRKKSKKRKKRKKGKQNDGFIDRTYAHLQLIEENLQRTPHSIFLGHNTVYRVLKVKG